jgi:hypothetical protein
VIAGYYKARLGVLKETVVTESVRHKYISGDCSRLSIDMEIPCVDRHLMSPPIVVVLM